MTVFVVGSHELFDEITHLLNCGRHHVPGASLHNRRRKGEISYLTLSWVGIVYALHQVHPKSLAKGEAL
jgi:hypothetical protein